MGTEWYLLNAKTKKRLDFGKGGACASVESLHVFMDPLEFKSFFVDEFMSNHDLSADSEFFDLFVGTMTAAVTQLVGEQSEHDLLFVNDIGDLRKTARGNFEKYQSIGSRYEIASRCMEEAQKWRSRVDVAIGAMEYKIVRFDTFDTIDSAYFDTYGNSGWELVSVVGSQAERYTCFFKRKKI